MEKKELMRVLQKIIPGELDMVLEKHKLWLATDGKEGERADLSYTDLEGADLRCVNLYRANLRHACLSDACLVAADLSYADLTGANLRCVNLYRANLRHANLCRADLAFADLPCANLQGADLRAAYLPYANLADANLMGVTNFPDIPMVCPTEGSFIGWKHAGNYIVKLEIPADAKRSSGTGIECRCNKAKVLAIEHPDGTSANVTEVYSDYDPYFWYRVGETVIVDDFDDNIFNDVPGISFYMDRAVVAARFVSW